MRRLALALLLAAAAAGSALAQNAPGDGGSKFTPSRAVGATHGCDEFYPETSRRLNESGDVMVRYDVLETGAVVNVALVKSSGFPRLDQAATTCVARRWRNTPALVDGKPAISRNHRAIIRFALDDEGLLAILADPAVFRIAMIIIGIFVAGAALMSSMLALRGRRPAAGALRRTCPNCGVVSTSNDMLRPPKFCTNCGLALPRQ
jgi:TonB family protein